jgi:glycosyltransferase involved in cell wall biosynthesis
MSASVAGLRVVGFVNTTDRRGAEVFAHTVLQQLAEQGADGELWAISPGTGSQRLDIDHLGGNRFDPRVVRRARELVRSADVAVAFGGNALQLAALATAGTDVPFAYRQIGDPSFWGRVRLADVRIGRPMRQAAAVVALWEGAGADLIARYQLDPAQVRVIPNARDGARFEPVGAAERAAAQESLGLDPGTTVAYLGALSWEKRPADAIRAIAPLPDVQLVLAGDGPLRMELEDLAAEAAPGRVRLTGVVSDARTVLHAADVLVCTSATEGMAGCLLEAGLCGVPVVATRVGAAEEVVEDGVTGVLVDVDDPIAVAQGIMRALDQREAMAVAARARTVERYSFEHVTPAWGSLLVELARSRRTS